MDKAIESGKEKRAPYRGAKRFTASCRNHGSCPYCRNAVRVKNRRAYLTAREQLDESSGRD